jgi:hypothetical protein
LCLHTSAERSNTCLEEEEKGGRRSLFVLFDAAATP